VSDFVFAVVGLAVAAISGWSLAHGFKTGTMGVPGRVYFEGNRDSTPFRFWIGAANNAMFLLCGLYLAVAMMRS